MSDVVHDGSETLKLDGWLAELRQRAAMPADFGSLDPATERALLDLTRVAAHRSERIAAPISAYLIGLGASEIPPGQRSAWIEGLARALDEPAE